MPAREFEHIKKQRFIRPFPFEQFARIKPVFEDFHLLTAEGDLTYPLHQHENYEIILVQKGPYRCTLNQSKLSLQEGQMLIIKPGDWHSDLLRKGQRHYVLHFKLQPASATIPEPRLFRENASPTEQIIASDQGHNTALIKEIEREATEARHYAGSIQDALSESLFWRVVRALPEQSLSPELRQLPQKEREKEDLAQAFASAIENSLSVADVAQSLKISPRQLANLCREYFSQSPAKLLSMLKTDRAEELIRYHGYRIKEVSHALGFSSPHHFSRVFKRLKGYPPSDLSRTESID
ncbi:AraC family transcriptional regulator [Pelagicoccus mobilis]|uniref:AraC family transcriptional regulator n=1 Tax=Pelagicoccus mobilis TaxID=415221 RepID=A0A934S2S0_9BACT|nr:AraC family transcriptional regulator [Pelagicoccus mobilis]MBK1880125.1 AraC family transcriptional regulator [Pelagicoccus mobilis]